MNRIERLSRIAVAALLVALAPAAAMATGQGIAAMKKWQQADNCAKQAQTAFPDFTAESNAKRDAKLQECLNGQNLPPREGLAPSR